ncbi:MAG: 2-dehydro-3-deoxygalactonokinase [Sphaerochaetaceae bacterium]|nr:2-dehydro-3-deoxygalactonokinase [Sphaerochaetaceae bacterium]
MSYCVYFDSGTTNSRIYVLNENMDTVYQKKVSKASRDAAISNMSLAQILFNMYTEALKTLDVQDNDISSIYASGLVTSPFGLKEVMYISVPISFENYTKEIVPFFEDRFFHRTINLMPGLRRLEDDFNFVNNVRGEETEVIGLSSKLSEMGINKALILLPGSHSQGVFYNNGIIEAFISNYTGEVFQAIRKETLLSVVFDDKYKALDENMISMALDNLEKFGFNRALYICHAMRLMGQRSPQERYAYGEGVINGGLLKSFSYYLEHKFPSYDTLVILSDDFNCQLFTMIFKHCSLIKKIVPIVLNDGDSYALEGFKKVYSLRGNK